LDAVQNAMWHAARGRQVEGAPDTANGNCGFRRAAERLCSGILTGVEKRKGIGGTKARNLQRGVSGWYFGAKGANDKFGEFTDREKSFDHVAERGF